MKEFDVRHNAQRHRLVFLSSGDMYLGWFDLEGDQANRRSLMRSVDKFDVPKRVHCGKLLEWDVMLGGGCVSFGGQILPADRAKLADDGTVEACDAIVCISNTPESIQNIDDRRWVTLPRILCSPDVIAATIDGTVIQEAGGRDAAPRHGTEKACVGCGGMPAISSLQEITKLCGELSRGFSRGAPGPSVFGKVESWLKELQVLRNMYANDMPEQLQVHPNIGDDDEEG